MLKLMKILVVDDSESDAALLLEEFKDAGYELISDRVETAEELSAALNRTDWDVILSDYVMTRFNGADALKLVRQKNSDVPFIVLSGIYGEEAAVEMMKAGANDYLLKNNLSRLIVAVEGEIEAAKSRGVSRHAEDSARLLAALVQSSDDAIYAVELDGTVLSWNRAAERIFGFGAFEIIGRNASMLYPEERLDELNDVLDRVKHGNHMGWAESARLRKNGRQIPVSVTTSPMRNSEGKIMGASVIARNITVRKRNEQERVKLIEELTEALANAKMLSGLLPLCSHCKRIRDEEGYWQKLEAYISEHSQAVFTHGICPECCSQYAQNMEEKAA